ncbi:ulp1 protease family [Trichoderma cornu-damae]|uniref:Ulp1 protease family n=1 Tax=Trichoderma cornu-damae TaxID=654480 RepID=A0A9P8QTI6_9HYPO|nr:ulp1 protease family [Trichoderma cornu-damae]
MTDLSKGTKSHLYHGSGTAVNTLNLRRHEAHDESDVPPTKRQKKDITRTYGQTTSPFFSKPRPTKSSDLQEVVVESPQDDAYDIRSTSSAGNGGVAARALSEYRHVLPPSRKGMRVRKSRASLYSSSQPQSDANSAKPNALLFPAIPSSSRGRLSVAPDSPDVLAFEGRLSATTDAVSDASRRFSAKRDRPLRLADTAGPQVKRHKPATAKEPIDISEDELQADCAKYAERGNGKNPASRFSDTPGGHATAPMRGDLHHTVFGKSARQPRSDDVAITRAVCGKRIYDRGGDANAVALRRVGKEGKRLEPVSEGGKAADEHAWLGIDLDHVRAFGYSEPSSRYGLIMRSQSGDIGPKLYLEFESIESAQVFRQILKSTNTGERVVKLKDGLAQSARDLTCHPAAARRAEESLPFDLRRSTRSSAPSSRRRMPSPDGWTELHPDWHTSWPAPLVFPPTGKNRATVDKIDIPRLDEREFLNDNLINFYIRYLEYKLEKERPELLRKVYFFSTFFFEKLRSTKGKINYDGVKAWTAKVDLLSYDYIFVPVNEHAHWYLAIICNVPNAVRSALEEKRLESSAASTDNAIEVIDASSSPRMSTVERELTDISLEDGATAAAAAAAAEAASAAPREAEGLSYCHVAASSSVPPSPTRKRKSAGAAPSKSDPTQPRIITLDSLGGPHPPTCKALKEYLVEEARTKRGIALTTVPTGMTARGIPEQNNFCDCGVFVLGYMQEFLANPDEAARKLLLKEELGWDVRPSELRNRIRELLFDLQVEQQKQHKQLEEEKKHRKAKRKSMAESSTQKPPPLKPAPLSSPAPRLPGAFPSDSTEPKPASEAPLPSPSESVPDANQLEGDISNSEPSHQDQQRSRAYEEEPQFVSSLSDGSSISPKITKEKTLPFPSSPAPEHGGRSSRFIVELKSVTGYDKSEFEEPTVVDDEEASIQFVRELSSPLPADKAGLTKTRETRRSRHSSRLDARWGATVH